MAGPNPYLRKYALNVDKKVRYKTVWRGGEREWANVRQYGYAAAYAVLIFLLLAGFTRWKDRALSKAEAGA